MHVAVDGLKIVRIPVGSPKMQIGRFRYGFMKVRDLVKGRSSPDDHLDRAVSLLRQIGKDLQALFAPYDAEPPDPPWRSRHTGGWRNNEFPVRVVKLVLHKLHRQADS